MVNRTGSRLRNLSNMLRADVRTRCPPWMPSTADCSPPSRDVTRPGVLELSRRLGRGPGDRAGPARPACRRSGCCAGFGPYVDLKALGFTVLAFTTLEIAQGQESVVIDALARIPEVLEVHKTTGPGDLLCRIVARTNEHLHEVLERVLATPGITRTTSALALASPVHRPTAYALPEALLARR